MANQEEMDNTLSGPVEVLASAYLAELAEDICANGGVAEGQSLADAMTHAHARRKAFAVEMFEGTTDRSKKARCVLIAKIQSDLIIRSAFARIEQKEIDAGRMRFLYEGRTALANIRGAK